MKKLLLQVIQKTFAFSLLLLNANLIAQTQPCFKAPVTYTVGGNYDFGITTADFNGDSKPDLAIGTLTGNAITVLLNSGTGTFSTSVQYTVGNQPTFITSSDFNGDGKMDLAVVNQMSNNISVLLNTGSGTFNPAVNYAIGSFPGDISCADFNGDGKIDIAVANQNDNNISVLLNNGTGAFNPQVTYPTGFQGSYWTMDKPAPFTIAAGDFNGDTRPDIAVGNSDWNGVSNNGGNGISILLNTGTGSFNTPVLLSGFNEVYHIVAADLNADNLQDLAIVGGGKLNVSLNNGGGTFTTKTSFSIYGYGGISVNDVNGDGKPDLIVGDGGGVSVSLNVGGGQFASAVSYSPGLLTAMRTAMNDFDGDGKIDIATTGYNNKVAVLLNCPTPIPPAANYSNLPTSVCLGSHVDASPSISGTPPQTYYIANPLISPQADTALAVCKNNHSVFVLFAGDSVRRYDSAGNYQFTYPLMPLGSHAIAADNNNRLFVVGPDNLNPAISQITCYDASGNMDFTFWNSSSTTTNYILNYIAGIAIGPDTKLYAADTLADIKVLTTDGSSQISSIPTPSNLQYSLYKPMGICFGKGGQMYVADAGNRNILARNVNDNNFYPVFTKIDTTWQPISVDVDTTRNNLYFTTRNIPHRVIMGNAANSFGDTLCTYDTLSSHITFASPNSLAVVNQNSWPNIWVSDTKSTTLNRINEITYRLKPALPAGLTFQLFGGITGTPTSAAPLTTYTVIVSNSIGTDSTTFSFAVDPPGPVSNTSGTLTASGNQTDGLTIHYFNSNNCAKMLEIADSIGGGMPGAVTVTQTVTPTISVFNADTFINRVTQINAQDGTDSAVISIYYTYLDIQHYNQSLGQNILSNDTVGGTMQVSVLQMHESPPNSGHLTPIKHGPLAATWSNTEHHWVVKFGIKRFSTFYLGDTARIGAFQCVNSHMDSIVTANNYYIWHNDTLWSTGVYSDTLVNQTGCDSVCTIKLTVNPSGIATPLLEKGVAVYPNPSTGLLNVTVNDPNVEVRSIRILNVMGEEVYTADDNSRNRKIDLGNLPKGFYSIIIISGQETITKKILIQ